MISDDVVLGEDVRIVNKDLVNLYGCTIGAQTRIGPFVEIQRGVDVGTRCKISSHSFVCSGVRIGDGVFIGHGVMFINDRLPRATTEEGDLLVDGDWELLQTAVENHASIGSGATILGGVTIGERALVGAGAVVTRDVSPHSIVVGNPARLVGDVRQMGAESH